jgi:hypothetical protein
VWIPLDSHQYNSVGVCEWMSFFEYPFETSRLSNRLLCLILVVVVVQRSDILERSLRMMFIFIASGRADLYTQELFY